MNWYSRIEHIHENPMAWLIQAPNNYFFIVIDFSSSCQSMKKAHRRGNMSLTCSGSRVKLWSMKRIDSPAGLPPEHTE